MASRLTQWPHSVASLCRVSTSPHAFLGRTGPLQKPHMSPALQHCCGLAQARNAWMLAAAWAAPCAPLHLPVALRSPASPSTTTRCPELSTTMRMYVLFERGSLTLKPLQSHTFDQSSLLFVKAAARCNFAWHKLLPRDRRLPGYQQLCCTCRWAWQTSASPCRATS